MNPTNKTYVFSLDESEHRFDDFHIFEGRHAWLIILDDILVTNYEITIEPRYEMSLSEMHKLQFQVSVLLHFDFNFLAYQPQNKKN